MSKWKIRTCDVLILDDARNVFKQALENKAWYWKPLLSIGIRACDQLIDNYYDLSGQPREPFKIEVRKGRGKIL